MKIIYFKLEKYNHLICIVLISLFLSGTIFLSICQATDGLSRANDDFIFVIDHSGSMREKVPGKPNKGYESDPLKAVKSRGAIDAICAMAENMLNEGDYFSLVSFGEKTNLIISQQIGYKHERDLIKRQIRSLRFIDKKTDILAGLKKAGDILGSLNTPHRRKIILMVTDGINEPTIYVTAEEQKEVYEQLRNQIHTNRWNVVIVGIGTHTSKNIASIIEKLNLPSSHGIVIENAQDSDEIMARLKKIIEQQRLARVETETRRIEFQLKPKFFGGYGAGGDSLTLISYFDKIVDIAFDKSNPIRMDSNDNINATVTPLNLALASQKPDNLNIKIVFQGKRPENGRLTGNYNFQFSKSSTLFYPHHGSYGINLISWWEIHGLMAIIATCCSILIVGFSFWAIRRKKVPQLRFIVTSEKGSLCEPMTLKIKDTLVIGNGLLGENFAIAKGLSCQRAVQLKYLGRRKFKVESEEAVILKDKKEVRQLNIGMNDVFNLRDEKGNMLNGVSITEPDNADDIFGDAGRSPF